MVRAYSLSLILFPQASALYKIITNVHFYTKNKAHSYNLINYDKNYNMSQIILPLDIEVLIPENDIAHFVSI